MVKNNLITLTVIFIMIFLFQLCYIFKYKPASCGVHRNSITEAPDSYAHLSDYTLYPKPKKHSVSKTVLMPGDYCFNYYHCNGPVNATVKLIEEVTDSLICVLDFSLSKKGNKKFTICKKGTYKFQLISNEWFVHFFILCDYKRVKRVN